MTYLEGVGFFELMFLTASIIAAVLIVIHAIVERLFPKKPAPRASTKKRDYTSREKRSVAASIMSATEPRGRTWA